MDKFVAGDKVKLRPNSEFYYQNNGTGVIKEPIERGLDFIIVKWDHWKSGDHTTNFVEEDNYPIKDLIKVISSEQILGNLDAAVEQEVRRLNESTNL